MKHSPGEYGFTLLELLVAFAILTVALVGIYQIYVSGFRSQSLAQDRLLVVHTAENLLAGIGSAFPLAEGAISGSTDAGLSYRITIRRSRALKTGTNSLVELFDIEVHVRSTHLGSDNGGAITLVSKKQAARAQAGLR